MVATIETDSPIAPEVKCYPLTTIASVKSLYLVNGLSAGEIAAKLGLDVLIIHNWARHYGWSEARKKLFAEAISPETVRGAVQAKLEAIALESSDLAQRTLALASDAIADGRTRDVMFAASAVKTFADVASKHSGNDASATAAIAVTFSLDSLYQPGAQVLNVTPQANALPNVVTPSLQA